MVTFAAAAPPADAFSTALARTFAAHVGVTLDRLDAANVLADESWRDPMTGVGNRRTIDAALRQLRPDDVVAVVDCDHFKAVNQRYGRTAGDAVIVDLAAHLDGAVRDGDTVARSAADEFFVVLRQAGESGVATVERLRRSWSDAAPVVTFSAGVAVHRDGQSPRSSVDLARGALERAKATGRDRVVDADAAHMTPAG